MLMKAAAWNDRRRIGAARYAAQCSLSCFQGHVPICAPIQQNNLELNNNLVCKSHQFLVSFRKTHLTVNQIDQEFWLHRYRFGKTSQLLSRARIKHMLQPVHIDMALQG